MGRKKKVVEPEVIVKVADLPELAKEVKQAEVSKISLLPTDMGRADLNTMAAKINEIIERINQ